MATPEWAAGLAWLCKGCAREWLSRWARDMCMMTHADEDRDARRR